VRIVLSILSKQPVKHIKEKRRLILDFFALNIPIRKRIKRIMALKSGGIL
jgi:hypothetical protein